MRHLKFLKIAASAMLVLALSGCYKVDFDASFENDGSGSLSYIIAVDYEVFAELSEESGQPTSKEEICSDTESSAEEMPDNARVEPYDQDGYCGVSAEIEIPENDDVMKELASLGDGQDELDGLVIDQIADDNWTFSQPSDATGMSDAESDQLDEAILESLEISYEVTLPGAPGENNAEEVATKDGKTTFSWGSDSVLGGTGLEATTVPNGSSGEVAASGNSSNSENSDDSDDDEDRNSSETENNSGDDSEDKDKDKDSKSAVASENDESDDSDNESASDEGDGGFPLALAIGAPLVLLAVLGGGVFLRMRNRKPPTSPPHQGFTPPTSGPISPPNQGFTPPK